MLWIQLWEQNRSLLNIYMSEFFKKSQNHSLPPKMVIKISDNQQYSRWGVV